MTAAYIHRFKLEPTIKRMGTSINKSLKHFFLYKKTFKYNLTIWISTLKTTFEKERSEEDDLLGKKHEKKWQQNIRKMSFVGVLNGVYKVKIVNYYLFYYFME